MWIESEQHLRLHTAERSGRQRRRAKAVQTLPDCCWQRHWPVRRVSSVARHSNRDSTRLARLFPQARTYSLVIGGPLALLSFASLVTRAISARLPYFAQPNGGNPTDQCRRGLVVFVPPTDHISVCPCQFAPYHLTRSPIEAVPYGHAVVALCTVTKSR